MTTSIPFNDLFNESFMKREFNLNSFDELMGKLPQAIHLNTGNTDDNPVLDVYINEHSRFGSFSSAFKEAWFQYTNRVYEG